jgi:DNA-binding NarL/FixJ family response regulator
VAATRPIAQQAAWGVVGEETLFRVGLLTALVRAGFEASVVDDEPVAWAMSGDFRALIVDDADGAAGRRLLQQAGAQDVLAVAVVSHGALEGYRDLLAAGAAVVVERSWRPERILDVVGHSLRHESVLPVDVARSLARVEPDRDERFLEDAELQLLRFVAAGGTVAGAAVKTHRSERDCYRMLARIWRKLDASNRIEGISRALRLGLLDELDPSSGRESRS